MKSQIKALVLVLGLVLFIVQVSAVEANYCCEKTVSGAYCVNAPADECDDGVKNAQTGERYLVSQTSCESTSYCKKGCCYDSDEGLCMENVPEEACRAVNGMWSDSADCSIGQCNLGCCLLGREASFVTLARCKKLSGYYGLETNFNPEISDEISCINLATSQDMGACVFESEYTTTCKFLTRGECNAEALGDLTDYGVTFYKDHLCTNPEFETDCARTKETVCDGEKVYFRDSCGNRANIYDASKVNDVAYWSKVVSAEESCQGGASVCGNCDYIGSGTICREDSGAQYGDNICQDVNCYDTSNGKDYKNGESWCYYDDGDVNTDSVGSRHYRHICIMGEEVVEACDDFRNQICVEKSIGEGGDFSQAGCVVNKYQDCVAQEDVGDCLSPDRDCLWLPIDPENPNPVETFGNMINYVSDFDNVVGHLMNVKEEGKEIPGKCVPRVAPGLMFWDESAEETCSVIDEQCTVEYEKGLFGDEWKCVDNCFCDPDSEEGKMLGMMYVYYCSSLGDCGAGKNFIGKYTNKGYEIYISKLKKNPEDTTRATSNTDTTSDFGGGGNSEFKADATSTTGNVVKGLIENVYGKIKDE